MKHLATILHTALILLTSSAAVPLRWTVETSRATPAAFEAYQGETLDFEAALMSHGKPLQAPSNYSLYWQTNGMGGVYWSTNCAAGAGATNVMRATWRPEYDAGAKVYNCFIGAPGDIYHAAFQLRLRPSPGAVPGALPLPTPTIDFARVTVLNPPWPTNDLTSAVASNAAAISSHSSQLTQLSQSLGDETERATTAEADLSQFIDEVADHCDAHLDMEEQERMREDIRVADNAHIELMDEAEELRGEITSATNALDAALREYPRVVRRGGMEYLEDIVDRGGDDITYSLTRFSVVTFTARTNATVITSVVNPDHIPTSARPTLECATTPEWAWRPFVLGETYVTLGAGERLHLRTPAGVTNGVFYGYSFRIPGGSANLSGDLMALASCGCPRAVTLEGQFRELWRMCTNLVDASEFRIGATNTTPYVFSKLFDGCVSLTKAPRRLSFNDAKTYSMNHFLAHCPITEAPEFDIPSASGERAMWGFFDSCASLLSCDISSLVSIEGNNCIRGLFDYCYSLERIKVGFTRFKNADWWVEDVQTAGGVFICPAALGDNDTIVRATTKSKAGCPVNWTVINY